MLQKLQELRSDLMKNEMIINLLNLAKHNLTTFSGLILIVYFSHFIVALSNPTTNLVKPMEDQRILLFREPSLSNQISPRKCIFVDL